MFLLDTNTVIYFFKGKGRVAERMLGISRREVTISAIVLHELETGIAKSNDPITRRGQLDTLLDATHFVPFGKPEAEAAAAIRAELEHAGTPIGPFDTLIAATALANRMILVTHNRREFSRVPGLVVEDWY